MKNEYIKGLRGEIVSLDSVDRIWKVLDEKTGNWEVWADSHKHSTEIFEGTEAEVISFIDALDDIFEPFDLTNEKERELLKQRRGPGRIGRKPKVVD